MTLTIPAGQTRAPLPLFIAGDDLEEDTEALSITILAAEALDDPALSLVVAPTPKVLTILDDDAEEVDFQEAVLNVVAPADVPEGDIGLVTRAFTLELSEPLGVEVAVDVVLEGTAAPNAADALDIAGGLPRAETLVIPAGATSAIFEAQVMGDTVREFDDGLSLRVTGVAVGEADGIDATVTVDTAAATTVIENDDTISVAISAPDSLIAEGDVTNPRDAVFVIERTGDLSGFTEVSYDVSEIVGPPRLSPLEAFNTTTGLRKIVGFQNVEGGSAFSSPTEAEDDVLRLDRLRSQSDPSLIEDLAAAQGIDTPDVGGIRVLYQEPVSDSGILNVGGALRGNYDIGFEYGLALDIQAGEQGFGAISFSGDTNVGILASRAAVEGETIDVTVNETGGIGMWFTADALSIDKVALDVFASITRESGIDTLTVNEPITGTELGALEGFLFEPKPLEFLEIVSVDEEGLSVDIPKIPVGVSIDGKLPTGEKASSQSGRLNEVLICETVAELVTVNDSLTELASFIPALVQLKALSADIDRSTTVGGVDVSAKLAYTLSDIPIGVGVGLVQRVAFIPDATVVHVTLDGEQQSGVLGEPLSFDLGDANTAYQGVVTYEQTGVLEVQYSIEPLGKIGYEALSGKVDLKIGDQEILKETKIGLLLEDETSGSVDFQVFEFDPIRLELDRNFFTFDRTTFTIPAIESTEPDLSGVVVFAPGETRKEIRLPIVPDETLEADISVRAEILEARQSDGSAVQVDDALAFLTVVDDDDRPFAFNTLDTARFGGNGGGDPHLTMIDGLNYSFQAVGEFVFLESASDAGPEAIAVQIRTAPVGDSNLVSSISAVALSFGGIRATIDVTADTVLRIDGVETQLQPGASRVFDGGAVIFDGSAYTFANNFGETVRVLVFSDFLDVGLDLLNDRAGAVRGLLGDADGNAGDDLQDATGSVFAQPTPFAELYGASADAWRLTDATSLFDYAEGLGTADFTDRSFPRAPVSLCDLPEELVAAATVLVDGAGVIDPARRDDAILDVALTGRAEFAKGASALRQSTVEELTVSDAPALPAAVGVRANSAVVSEGDAGETTEVGFTVYRLGDLSTPATVLYSIQSDATLADQTPLEGRVTFAQGEATALIAVGLVGNDTPADATSVRVNLLRDPNATESLLIAGPSADTRVENDDGAIPVELHVFAVDSAIAERTIARFRIERAGGVDAAATITANIVAFETDANDFAQSIDLGKIFFAAGVRSRFVDVAINGDDLIEPDETFRLEARLDDAMGFADVVITNDDALPVAFDDLAETRSGDAVSIDVLANDDTGGDGPLVVISVDDAGNGSTEIVDGQILYSPATGYSGVDRFTYTVRDALGVQSIGQVAVDVKPAAAVGTSGDDDLTLVGGEAVDLLGGVDVVSATLETVNGAIIENFGEDDTLVIKNTLIPKGGLGVTGNPAVLDIDADLDGVSDARLTLTGDFSEVYFDVTAQGNDTEIAVSSLPEMNGDEGTPFKTFLPGTFGATKLRFDGDDFVLSGAFVRGRKKYYQVDDLLDAVAHRYWGTVQEDGVFDDPALSEGGISVDRDGRTVTLSGEPVGGDYVVEFDGWFGWLRAKGFERAATDIFELIDENNVDATDPTEFHLDVLGLTALFDAQTDEFAFFGEDRVAQRFEALEPFVEALVEELGGVQIRDGNFKADHIADGRIPNVVRLDGDGDLKIAGKSVKGRFEFELPDTVDGPKLVDDIRRLFEHIEDAGALASGESEFLF